MDKIINILLLIIIVVFDPLAISLVVAANFAFDKAYPKKRENLYGELEDDFSEWDKFIEDETEEVVFDDRDGSPTIRDIEVEEEIVEEKLPDEAREVETPDWKVVDENGIPIGDKVIKALQKGPSNWRVLLESGNTIKLNKDLAKRLINRDDDLSKSY